MHLLPVLRVCKPEWLACLHTGGNGSHIMGGQGGSLPCWVAELGERVILKHYRRQRDYELEAAVLPQLAGHPHIIEALCGDAQRRLILLEEGVDGDLTHSLGDLKESDLPMLVKQLVQAVAAVHERGWVHMDVKPENVVRRGPHLKLIDFGLVMSVEAIEPERGTAHTMAPEVLPRAVHRPRQLGYALDWWSLGVTIFYLAQRLHPNCSPRSHHGGYPYRLTRDWRLQWAPEKPVCFSPELIELLYGHLLVMDPAKRTANATSILSLPFFK